MTNPLDGDTLSHEQAEISRFLPGKGERMRLKTAYIILWCLTTTGITAECGKEQNNHPWHEYRGSCYFVSIWRVSHMDAVAQCDEMGAKLTSVRSSSETRFLLKKMGCGDNGDCDKHWIGLVKDTGDLNNQYGWRWLDGSPVSWTNWDYDGVNEPNSASGAVEIDSDGEWYDQSKDVSLHFICKKAQIAEEPTTTSVKINTAETTTQGGEGSSTELTTTNQLENDGNYKRGTYLYVGVGIAVIVVTIIVVVTTVIILRRINIRIVDNIAMAFTPARGHVTYINMPPCDDVGDYEKPYKVLKTDVYANGPGSNIYADLQGARK